MRSLKELFRHPKVSVIVASYNYGNLIGKALTSILDQTADDLEIVVIDDASTDNSRDVIHSLKDGRIRYRANPSNIGPSRTYNRAAKLARGAFITYVDADDWIDKRKFERQLAHFEQHPDTDILGTYANFHAVDGGRHPRADALEAHFNQARDFNAVEQWIGGNSLAAPSVMMRRSVQERIGLRDPAMVFADYELWTRALRDGCRFDMVASPLLSYRLHDSSASHVIPPGDALLETAYILHRNLLPKIKISRTFRAAMTWILRREQLGQLEEAEQFALLAFVLGPSQKIDFAGFRQAFAARRADPELIAEGRGWYEELSAYDSGEGQRFERRIEVYLSHQR